MIDLVLTIREVAEALKVADTTVYDMVQDGELPAFQVRGEWRIRRADFERWLTSQMSVARRDLTSNDESAGSITARHGRAIGHSGQEQQTRKDGNVGDQHLSDLTERLDQAEMHHRFVNALGSSLVRSHAPLDCKPFEVDLAAPLPQRVRIYMYNATRPPGGRPLGEHKIQLIVPGQNRDQRGSFDNGDGRIVLLVGYAAEEDVFVLWDAGLYANFAWSRNVQVKGHTIIDATAGKIATQERRLRPATGRSVVETVLAAKTRNLAQAIERRMELTRQRLLRD